MQQEQIKKILSHLADHESRLKQLENGERTAPPPRINMSDKKKTLREIVKGKKFKNGQEQIAAIVGYHEKVLGQLIPKDKITNSLPRYPRKAFILNNDLTYDIQSVY